MPCWGAEKEDGSQRGKQELYLQDGEILQDAVHHVLLREVLEFVDKVDHVFTHGRTMDSIYKPAVLQPRVLCLQENGARGSVLPYSYHPATSRK